MTDKTLAKKSTPLMQEHRSDIQTLILANLSTKQIAESLGLAGKTVSTVKNRIMAELENKGIDISKATSLPARKALLFSVTHDVLSGLLLSELFKTKRALQGCQATNTTTTGGEEGVNSLRSKRSTGAKAAKPATEAMLYNRLGLLSDQIRKNNKAYFDVVGPMGVADSRTPLQTKGPLCLPTDNNFENMSESAMLEELLASSKRQAAYATRQLKVLVGRVELAADCEVVDE